MKCEHCGAEHVPGERTGSVGRATDKAILQCSLLTNPKRHNRIIRHHSGHNIRPDNRMFVHHPDFILPDRCCND